MGISEKMAAKSIRLASSCSTSSSAAQRKAGGAGCVWARKSKTQMMCRRTRVRRVRRVRCSATSSSELCRDKVSSPKVREAVEGERVHKITFVGEEEQIDEGLAILCMARASSDMTIEAQCDWGNISMTEWQGGTFKTGSPTPLADA